MKLQLSTHQKDQQRRAYSMNSGGFFAMKRCLESIHHISLFPFQKISLSRNLPKKKMSFKLLTLTALYQPLFLVQTGTRRWHSLLKSLLHEKF